MKPPPKDVIDAAHSVLNGAATRTEMWWVIHFMTHLSPLLHEGIRSTGGVTRLPFLEQTAHSSNWGETLYRVKQ